MPITTNGVRFMLFASALVFGLIALGIIALVIPPVLADTFPGAMPERAAKAFAVPVGLDIMFALLVFLIARRRSDTSPGRGWILASLGAVASVVNLVLLDAAGAFSGHGTHMATVTVLLFVFAVMGFLAGILLIVSAVLHRKRRSHAIDQPVE
jgi:hypothetical protein